MQSLLVLLCVHFSVDMVKATVTSSAEPEFTEPLQNFTVTAGRDVRLACAVKHLGSYKVAWIHLERSAILTVQTHVITRNPRISISNDQHKTWTLTIADVQESDHGGYMCQINTAVAKSQVGYLSVLVPPSIDDTLSSSDVTTREGSAVNLTCNATGSSPLTVRWKREDGKAISISKTLSVNEWEGFTLPLARLTRSDMGAYLCIASNGVPPTVSKRILIAVEFAPVVWAPLQLVGAPVSSSITLECVVESYPAALHYWDRSDGIVLYEPKYRAESSSLTPGAALAYRIHLRLTVSNITVNDYGSYRCLAKNHFGEAEGTVKLYPTSSPTTTIFQPHSDTDAEYISSSTKPLVRSWTEKPTVENHLKLAGKSDINPGYNVDSSSIRSQRPSKSNWTFSWKASTPTSSGAIWCPRFSFLLLLQFIVILSYYS